MTRGSKSKKKEKHLLKLFADGKQPDWFDFVETLFKPHVKVWTPHVEVTNWRVALQFIEGGLDPHEIFSNRTYNLRHGGSTEVEQEAFLWAVDSGLRCAVLHFLSILHVS